MKRGLIFIGFALVIAFFAAHPADASQVNFIVQGADKANWVAGIYDEKKLQTETVAGYYNTLYDFEIGWNAKSGTATFIVGDANPKTWDTGLTGQVPGLINLIAYDKSNKFSYTVSLLEKYSLLKPINLFTSIEEKNSKPAEIAMYPADPPMVKDLWDFWFVGTFGFGQADKNDNPGTMNISWQISMDSFKPVPIPNAALLLGTGLIALVAIRRRRR